MKLKKILFTFSFLFVNLIAFSQQIGSGFATGVSDFNIELPSGFYQGYNATGQIDGGGWNHLLNLRHSDPGNNHQLQIASSYTENDRLFFRKFARATGSSNPDWHEIATRDGNTFNGNQNVNGELKISSYSPLLVLQRDTNAGGFIQGIQTKNLDNADNWFFGNLHSNSWIVSKGDFNNAKFTVLDNGNVGIGTTSPIVKLDLGGTTDQDIGVKTALSNYAFYGAWQNEAIIAINRRPSDGTFTQTTKGAASINLNSNTSGSYIKFTTNNIVNTLGEERMRIIENGNVGIGTTTPDQKLTVNGIIHAKEIIVDTNITPDYVFQKYYTGKSKLKSDYVMPTLAEIENFTKKNHHLPNVPSAQEVQQNGVSLGTMSNVLLQKVEELTLYAIEQNKYVIEQQKKLDEQNRTIEIQSKILADLTARLNSLEKR